MRLRTRNVRSLCRSGSLTPASREIANYNLDLVSVQKVRWDEGDTVGPEDYSFIYGKKMNISNGKHDILYNTE